MIRTAVMVCLLLTARHAAAQDLLALVRSNAWAAADALAAQSPDPVARKLVTYWRLLAPNAATTTEISAFMVGSPDWPQQATLARRRDDAVAAEPDDATAATVCDGARPAVATPAGRLRCADAYARLGRAADALRIQRLAWIEGPSDVAWETAFMQRRGSAIGSGEQWRRFDRLAWTDPAGAKRAVARLDPSDKPRAETLLALKRDDPSAPALVAALPPALRDDPAMFLERARWLRRAGQDDDAVALWRAGGTAAERAAPSERLVAFWEERNLLARRRLRLGDTATAYALVADTGQRGPEQIADAQFLAGFLALRKMNDLSSADRHFAELGRVSKAAITQARAFYWRGRTALLRNDASAANGFFREAAAYPNTYYGQLAIVALGDGDRLGATIAAARDPQPEAGQAVAFAGRELARAATLIVAWGEPYRAASFLLRLADVAPDPGDRALTAKFAAALGLSNTAIWVARRAGRDGISLIQEGWPIAADIPPDAGVDPAFALGIIRQESSFDTATTSPVGARGLMQLMPGTAAEVSKQLGLPTSIPALITDPVYNMRLGTAYLSRVLAQFDGSIPMAAAAYNAGPGRVKDWISGFGDPRDASTDVIDWIELIPLGETRNYVQRVIENTVIYRAERGQPDPHPFARSLR